MQLGETSRWHASQAAVRPDLVVVRSPDRHGHPGLMQGLVRISAIVDACFRLIVDGESVLPWRRWGSAQELV